MTNLGTAADKGMITLSYNLTDEFASERRFKTRYMIQYGIAPIGSNASHFTTSKPAEVTTDVSSFFR